MNILDTIVEEKKCEVARLPERALAAGDLRDALLEHGERRDFIAAIKSCRSRGDEAQTSRISEKMEPLYVSYSFERTSIICGFKIRHL